MYSQRQNCKHCVSCTYFIYNFTSKGWTVKYFVNFFVVGSRQSSNSQRLVEVAKKNGSKESYLVHQEFELPIELIKKSKCIGISSGASAPEVLVDQLIDQIKEIRNIKVQDIEIVKESVEFKLPKELREI